MDSSASEILWTWLGVPECPQTANAIVFFSLGILLLHVASMVRLLTA